MLKRLVAGRPGLPVTRRLPLPAAATDYTDIWYLPAESGLGREHGPGRTTSSSPPSSSTARRTSRPGTPRRCSPTRTATSPARCTQRPAPTSARPGTRARSSPRRPARPPSCPPSPYVGTLTYTINGGPTVTKSIQRQCSRRSPSAATTPAASRWLRVLGQQLPAMSPASTPIPLRCRSPSPATAPRPSVQLREWTELHACPARWCNTDCSTRFPTPAITCSDGTKHESPSMDEIKATAHGRRRHLFGAVGSAAVPATKTPPSPASCCSAASVSGARCRTHSNRHTAAAAAALSEAKPPGMGMADARGSPRRAAPADSPAPSLPMASASGAGQIGGIERARARRPRWRACGRGSCAPMPRGRRPRRSPGRNARPGRRAAPSATRRTRTAATGTPAPRPQRRRCAGSTRRCRGPARRRAAGRSRPPARSAAWACATTASTPTAAGSCANSGHAASATTSGARRGHARAQRARSRGCLPARSRR